MQNWSIQVKNAVLHVSYTAPVRVSDVIPVVAARDKTLVLVCFVLFVDERFITLPLVRTSVLLAGIAVRDVVPRPVKMVVGRVDVVRSVVGVVDILFCVALRPIEFPSRTAAPACATDIASAITKIRIFFISDRNCIKNSKIRASKICDFI